MTAVNKISDFKMERYLLGELPEQEMRELKDREASDDIFAARVKMLREQNESILKESPFTSLESKLDDALDARKEMARSFNGMWLKVAAALVVALGIFSAVVLNRDVSTFDSAKTSMEVAMADGNLQAGADQGGTRIKGLDARIEVWKKMGDSAVQMQNLGNAHEGDEIQLRYSVPEKCFGMLFSLDGNGTVTMHMADDNHAIELKPGKMTTLPFAYKLDNAPKFETFYLLTSSEGFSIDINDIDAVFKNEKVRKEHVTLRKVEK